MMMTIGVMATMHDKPFATPPISANDVHFMERRSETSPEPYEYPGLQELETSSGKF